MGIVKPMFKTALLFTQAVSGIVLVLLVLIQSKGSGFSRGFLSTSNSFTRRGLEKLVFKATFVVCAIFILASIAQVVI